MALDDAGLLDDLEDLIDGTTAYPATATAAGVNWADVYGAYALTGTADGVAAVEVVGARATLAASLGTAFGVVPGVAATTIASIRAALDVYWSTGVTFVGASPPVPTGGVALEAALLAISAPTHPAAALGFRDALAAYTKLVQVTFPGPVVVFVV